MNILLNRNFQMPADGWFHIAPIGEFPGQTAEAEPRRFIQVIDSAAVAHLKNRFDEAAKEPNFPGILVDYDHFSTERDKPSEAAGWITALENRSDGLWAQIRFSDLGEQAVRGGRYRMVSPVWDFEVVKNDRVRPTRLRSVALTNDPNLKGLVPLSNRQTGESGAGNPNQQPKGTNSMDYKTALLKLLGLPAEATDEQISAACTPAMENMCAGKKAGEMQNRIQTLEGELNNRDLDAAGITDATERATALDILANAKDRSAALALLKNRQPQTPGTQPPLHNRSAVQTPATIPGSQFDLSVLRNRAVADYQNINKCSFEQAWDAVRFTKPELFQDKQS